jgi:hypothetical protein
MGFTCVVGGSLLLFIGLRDARGELCVDWHFGFSRS